jgi:periplasmic protein TonB
LSAYRLPLPYERPPLQRRASGLALAVAVNVALLLLLLTLGRFAPEAKKASQALMVDLVPESHSAAATTNIKVTLKPNPRSQKQPPKSPPIVLPSKPTIAVPPARSSKPAPFIEMSSAEMAASDLRALPKGGSGSEGDSEVVGTGPHGEVLYAAEWARHPTDAQLSGYLPANAPDGYGLIACRTIPGDRVDDCIELDQEPRGSHLASAVRQAAWQFRVRPPRKNGVPLVGSWVRIEIDYERVNRTEGL